MRLGTARSAAYQLTGILTLSGIALAAGCGGDDGDEDPDPPAGGGGTTATGAGGATGGGGFGGSADGGGGAGGTSPFSIQFDYRFDTKGLFDADARAALEAAGAIWAQWIVDEFDDIPSGTEVLTRDPEDPYTAGEVFAIDYAIDDLVVFVGFYDFDGPGGTLASSTHSAAIGSVSDPTLQAALGDRYHGSDFEPWTGWISFDEDESWFFDTTPGDSSDIPSSSTDFISVALHELGHVLGFGAADAFVASVSGTDFIGPSAAAAYGGPVPLSGDLMHIDPSVRVGGERPLMDPSDASGERYLPTSLDVAFFEDLGYLISQ